MIIVALSLPVDRRCLLYDTDKPAAVSSISLSSKAEELVAVVVVEVVVGDSNRWGDVSELYKDTNYGSLLLVNRTD